MFVKPLYIISYLHILNIYDEEISVMKFIEFGCLSLERILNISSEWKKSHVFFR